MKLIVFFALITPLCPLFAAGESKPATDPLAGAFFPPELVLLAHDRIALTQEQQDAIRAGMEKAKSQSDVLQATLQNQTAALASLAKQDHVDEAALDAQLDKVLDAERPLKHLYIGLMATIKNLLTPEQETQLREIEKDGGKQFEEDTRNRLSGKVERIKEGVQKWAAGGRDPSDITKAMEEKFKPLIDAGKPVEAEAELDRLLEELNKDAK